MTAILTLLAIVGVAGSAAAQQPQGGERGGAAISDFLAQADSAPDMLAPSHAGSAIFPTVWCPGVTDAPTRDQCWEAYRAGLGYYQTGLRHRARVFAWQHLSTQVIFFVVLGLVLVGVYFAWLQFQRGLSAPPTGREQASAEGGRAAEGHEIEISLKGIKVSSPVLGLVILALSLAFFYLYLVYVYPIREIF